MEEAVSLYKIRIFSWYEWYKTFNTANHTWCPISTYTNARVSW